MIDQEMDFPAADHAWQAWPTELGRTAEAVIALTRQAWASRGNESPSSEGTGVKRDGFAHPLVGIA